MTTSDWTRFKVRPALFRFIRFYPCIQWLPPELKPLRTPKKTDRTAKLGDSGSKHTD